MIIFVQMFINNKKVGCKFVAQANQRKNNICIDLKMNLVPSVVMNSSSY